MIPPLPTPIADAINSAPPDARKTLLEIRALIFVSAAQNPAIGPLTETLKWGEPAYLTEKTKSGSTVRMAWKKTKPNHVGLYLNCKTSLINRIRDIYPDTFKYEGTRAALIDLAKPLPTDALAHAIEMALTYHSAKQKMPPR